MQIKFIQNHQIIIIQIEFKQQKVLSKMLKEKDASRHYKIKIII